MPSARSTLRQRGLLPVLTAEVISTVGTQLTAVALPWFVLTSSGSPARSGFVAAAETAPVLIFGVISGGWVERIGARRWMLISDICRAPLIALIPVLSILGVLPFWLLLIMVFAIGSFVVPYGASQQMLLAEAVGDDEIILTQATSILQGASRLTMLIGPPMAGLLIAVLGPRPVLLVDALSYLVVVGIILARGPRTARIPTEDRSRRVLDGLRVLGRDRLLVNWTAATIIGEMAYQALFLSIPILVYVRYQESSAVVGLLIGAFGAGALFGSVIATAVANRFSAVRVSVIGKVAQALVFFGMLPVLTPTGVAIVLFALGAFNGLTNGPSFAVRLARIPVPLRAKALTAITAGTMLGATVGLAGSGPAFQAFRFSSVFAVLAGLQVISAALFVVGARQVGQHPTMVRESVAG